MTQPVEALWQEPLLNAPKFDVDSSWPKPLPDCWVTGDVAGTGVDSRDHVFIANRRNLTTKELLFAQPAPPIIEFDQEGNVVNSWGDVAVLPTFIHDCYVDYEDNVWVSGYQDAIVQKYSHEGKLLLQIGTKHLFDTSDGTSTGAAMSSSQTLLNRPASIAVDAGNGDIYIADGYGNRRVIVFDREGNYLRRWGQQGTIDQAESGVGGVFVDAVHCLVLGKDDLLYVCDRKGDRIQVFDKAGNFQRNVYVKKGTGRPTDKRSPELEKDPYMAPFLAGIGSAWWLAFSADPAQSFMYVTDGSHDVVWIIERSTGKIISNFGRPGHQAGDFSMLHSIATDSKGNIFTGETVGGRRVQKFTVVRKIQA